MRPTTTTPVHQTSDLAELVCSNSLRGNALDQAAGLLKEEMRRMDSLVIRVADEVQGAGGERPCRGQGAVCPSDHRGGGVAAPGPAPPGRARPHSRRPGDHRGHGPPHLGRSCPGDRRLRGRRAPLLLRRREPRRGSRYDRLHPRLPRLALRKGRGRLPQLPAQRGGVRRVLRGPHFGRVRDPPRLRARVLLRGLPAGRGDREPRAGHPPVRPDEARGPRGPADRPQALRRRAAPPGQPRGEPLLDGRLPDPAQVGGAEADLPDDPRPREGRVRALRDDPPQHLRERSQGARTHLRDPSPPRPLLRRADVAASRATSSRRPRVSSRAWARLRAPAAGPPRPFPRTRPWARWAATSREATRSAISRRTSPLACCPSCRSACATRAGADWLLRTGRCRASSASGPPASWGRRRRPAPLRRARTSPAILHRRVPPPSRPGTQRLAPHGARLRRGPGAVPRARRRRVASAGAPRRRRPPPDPLVPGPPPSSRPQEDLGRAEAREHPHVLSLPLPRGDPGQEPRPCASLATSGAADPRPPRGGGRRPLAGRARRRGLGPPRPGGARASLCDGDSLLRSSWASTPRRSTSDRA